MHNLELGKNKLKLALTANNDDVNNVVKCWKENCVTEYNEVL